MTVPLCPMPAYAQMTQMLAKAQQAAPGVSLKHHACLETLPHQRRGMAILSTLPPGMDPRDKPGFQHDTMAGCHLPDVLISQINRKGKNSTQKCIHCTSFIVTPPPSITTFYLGKGLPGAAQHPRTGGTRCHPQTVLHP